MKPVAEEIEIECSLGWRDFLDLTRDGAPLPLAGYQFQLPFMASGAVLAVGGVAVDPDVAGRIWMEVSVSEAAKLPAGRSSIGYLLVKDPAGAIELPLKLPAKALKGGPAWSA